MGHGVRTAVCPGCGDPPSWLLEEQAFCCAEHCAVLFWNPTWTLEENVASMSAVQIPEWLQGLDG